MSIVGNHWVCHHHLIARKLELFQIITVLHFHHRRQVDGGLACPTALRSRHLAPRGLVSVVPFVCKIRVIALQTFQIVLLLNVACKGKKGSQSNHCQRLALYVFYMLRDSHYLTAKQYIKDVFNNKKPQLIVKLSPLKNSAMGLFILVFFYTLLLFVYESVHMYFLLD